MLTKDQEMSQEVIDTNNVKMNNIRNYVLETVPYVHQKTIV